MEKIIVLTDSQKRVLHAMKEFVTKSDDRVFILKGYAGTGKTTLMKFLIAFLNEKRLYYKLLASTGRAAKVLSNLTGDNSDVSTIHSLIYSFIGLNKDLSDVEKPTIDETGQLLLNFESVRVDEKTTPKYIYIVDESSMISDVENKNVTQAKFGTGRVLKELLDYDKRQGSKFIFVGDPCQLPPIEEYYSPALSVDYFKSAFNMNAQEKSLTEIMRTEDGNSIISVSKSIRTLYAYAPEDKSVYGFQRVWGKLDFRNRKDIKIHHSEDEMISDLVSNIKDGDYESAVCICMKNSTCSEVSAEVRRRLGFTPGRIQKGDLLLVIQNNMCTRLMNGDMVTVESISSQMQLRADLTFRHVTVKELFTGRVYSTLIIEDIVNLPRLNLNSFQQNSLFLDFIMRMKKIGITQKNKKKFENAMRDDIYLNALRCVFGYAVTCHKAQGGEWNDVYVMTPGNITLNPTKASYQWIYTAITRTKKNLHLKDAFYLK